MRPCTEGRVHLAMRKGLRDSDFKLIAGEYPGGSDHELYPLNVTDPRVARDRSPDPRRHSVGELIPDIVALKDRWLVLGEAKVDYNDADRAKLAYLTTERVADLRAALHKFARERNCPELEPIATLEFLPVLIFTTLKVPPLIPRGFSYMRLAYNRDAIYEGPLSAVVE